MKLCWFVSSYFYTFSSLFTKRGVYHRLPNIVPRDENEAKIIDIFIYGNALDELIDNYYDFELALANYFIPILKKFSLNFLLNDMSAHLFTFPFMPKVILKNRDLNEYFVEHFYPGNEQSHYQNSLVNNNEEGFSRHVMKDKFLFSITDKHVFTYFIDGDKKYVVM